MRPEVFAKAHESGCVLTIDASPGASRSEIIGVNRWRGALQIRIAAAAKDGEANRELVRFLAERLQVQGRSVRIVRGERSTIKTVFVPMSVERVVAILGDE